MKANIFTLLHVLTEKFDASDVAWFADWCFKNNVSGDAEFTNQVLRSMRGSTGYPFSRPVEVNLVIAYAEAIVTKRKTFFGTMRSFMIDTVINENTAYNPGDFIARVIPHIENIENIFAFVRPFPKANLRHDGRVQGAILRSIFKHDGSDKVAYLTRFCEWAREVRSHEVDIIRSLKMMEYHSEPVVQALMVRWANANLIGSTSVEELRKYINCHGFSPVTPLMVFPRAVDLTRFRHTAIDIAKLRVMHKDGTVDFVPTWVVLAMICMERNLESKTIVSWIAALRKERHLTPYILELNAQTIAATDTDDLHTKYADYCESLETDIVTVCDAIIAAAK